MYCTRGNRGDIHINAVTNLPLLSYSLSEENSRSIPKKKKNRINTSIASTLVEYETLPQASLDALVELIARKDLGTSS
jgi:hypothetical protein